ncbi:MAG: hypothetical protein OXQ28_10480 [Acidobacteriota bacterium]|nr:hypothetical protein [Acidobacteriota bacterium]
MTSLLVTLVLALGGVLAGCGGGGEEQALISSFFRASRFNDRPTLSGISMVAFSPQEDGTVGSFDVENVAEEQRRPLRMRELSEALQEVRRAQQEFADGMKMYQDENSEAVIRVLEAERADEDVGRRDRDVQEEWTRYRDESQQHSRAVSDAESELNAESSVPEVSAYDPNNPIAVRGLEGELVTKEVTISAEVDRDGSSENRTMVITLQMVELDGPDGLIEGRWIITDIQ